MPILRTQISDNYTKVPNKVLQDSTLSYGALGLLVRILSYPDNWEIRKKNFITARYGRDKITNLFKELQSAGYLTRKFLRRNRGKFSDHVYIISNYPQHLSTDLLKIRQSAKNDLSKKPHKIKDIILSTETQSLGHLSTENQETVFQSTVSPLSPANTESQPKYWKSAPIKEYKYNIYTKENLGVYFNFKNMDEEESFFEKPLDASNKILLKIAAGLILAKFNKLSKNLYKSSSQNLAPIITRLKEGTTVRECIQIIFRKHKEWKNTDLIKFLTPTTIFKNNFDEYLAELRGAERAILIKQKQLEQNYEKK